MAPNKKTAVAEACHAMEKRGISKAKTKAVMRELFKLYGTSWELILDEGFKPLIDALMHVQVGEEGTESGKKQVSHDKPAVQLPSKRYGTRGQVKHALLKEECSKSSKSRTVQDYQKGAGLSANSDSEPEEPEVPLARRKRSRNQDKLAVVPVGKQILLNECSKLAKSRIAQDHQIGAVLNADSNSESEEPKVTLARRKCSRNQNEPALVPIDNPCPAALSLDEMPHVCRIEETARATWTYDLGEQSHSKPDVELPSSQSELALVPVRNPAALSLDEMSHICWTEETARATQQYVLGEQSCSNAEVQPPTNTLHIGNHIQQAFFQEDSSSCLEKIASKQEHQSVIDLSSNSEPGVLKPLVMRKCSRNETELALVTSQNPISVNLGEDEVAKICCIEEVAKEAHPYVLDEWSSSKVDLPENSIRNEYFKQSSPQCCTILEKTELSQPYPCDNALTCDLPQHKQKNSKILGTACRESITNSEGGNDIVNYETSRSRNEPCFYHKDSFNMLGGELFVDNQMKNEVPLAATLSGENSQVEADVSKFLELAELPERDKVASKSDGSKYDIASSPNGEVKVAFLHNSSQQSAFHVPSPTAVLEAAEKKFIEVYKISEPSFSLKKMMTELCELFLEMGKGSTLDELIVSSNLQPSQKPGADDIQGNHCILSTVPSEPFKLQNLVNVLQEAPKPIISRGLEGLQDNHSSQGVVRRHSIYVDDLARGEERVKITLENGSNVDNPPSFLYISQNMVYDKACVEFVLDGISNKDCCKHCSGNCLTSPETCKCAKKTKGGFAYTLKGLLKEEFLEECISVKRELKGNKEFIKECWSKCRCGKHCGNRVVQRGMSVNLQVFWTPEGKGWGVRTLEHLSRGAFVCEYIGEILTSKELHERNMQNGGTRRSAYPVLLDAYYGSEAVQKNEQPLGLDATHFGNVARFINHRCCDASLIEIPVEVETPDRSYYHVALFTTRKIDAMEELTWDYGIDFEHQSHSVTAFRCLCGSSFCGNRN